MKKSSLVILICSHICCVVIGVFAGLYSLPILSAPPSPTAQQMKMLTGDIVFNAKIPKSLKGSDFLHWGEGQFSLSSKAVMFNGRLAPGPNYKLYLSPRFVETEAQFKHAKSTMLLVGEVKTFNNFITTSNTPLPLGNFTTVVVWCESFDEFITSAKYR